MQVLEQSNFRLRTVYDKAATEATTSSPVGAVASTHNSPLKSENGHRNSEQLTNASSFSSQFHLLEMDRYGDTHLLSQEVMNTIVPVSETTSDVEINLQETEETARELGRTSKQMQTSITQVRMRPVSI